MCPWSALWCRRRQPWAPPGSPATRPVSGPTRRASPGSGSSTAPSPRRCPPPSGSASMPAGNGRCRPYSRPPAPDTGRDGTAPARRRVADLPRRLGSSLLRPEADLDHLQAVRVGGLLPGDLHERPTVLDRHHLLELGQVLRPILQDGVCARRVGVVHVPSDQLVQALGVLAGEI